MTEMLTSLNDQLVSGITQARKKFLSRLEVLVINRWAGVGEAGGSNVWVPPVIVEEGGKVALEGGKEWVDVKGETVDEVEVVSPPADDSLLRDSSFASPDPTESDKLRKLMDIAPLSSHESHTSGLVDTLAHKRPHNPRERSILNPTSGSTSPPSSTDATPSSDSESSSPSPTSPLPSTKMSLTRYRLARTEERKKELAANEAVGKEMTKVGLVYLCGSIMRGDEQFGSNTVAKAITEAAEDAEVGAVCLRIDSGGGDVVASETIWEAVKYAQDVCKKPVIASFGNVAASGAYYISAPCTKILASPGTLTGSIGVAATRPYITPKLLSTLGLNVGEIHFSEGAKTLSALHELRGGRLERFRRQTDEMYEVFLEK
ncbi:hypothetical protein HK097_001844, partial [Rhizophlyctis rosea]